MTKPTNSPSAATIASVNEAKTNAWNKHISAKLEAVQVWLKQDPGVWAYLTAQMQTQVDQLIRGCSSRDDDQYVRGRIAMLREIIHLPEGIAAQLEAADHNRKLQASAYNDL